jgi:hypothetical protein
LGLATPRYNQNSVSEVIGTIQSWHRSLGINIYPEIRVIIQQEQWKHKEKHVINISKTQKMSYREAEVIYKTIYNPQIQYLLPFSKEKDTPNNKGNRGRISKMHRILK